MVRQEEESKIEWRGTTRNVFFFRKIHHFRSACILKSKQRIYPLVDRFASLTAVRHPPLLRAVYMVCSCTQVCTVSLWNSPLRFAGPTRVNVALEIRLLIVPADADLKTDSST